jgi:hypothetical protein
MQGFWRPPIAGVEGPRASVDIHAGCFELADAVDIAHAPWTYRIECAVFGRIPVLRDVGRTSRFAFGPGRS